jgi:hypothetical protein
MSVDVNSPNVKIEAEFAPLMKSCSVLMQTGGGKIIPMEDGSFWVVGVGITPIETEKAALSSEKLRQLTVAKAKAQLAVLESLKGFQQNSKMTVGEQTKLEIKNGVETSTSKSSINSEIAERVFGECKNLPPVGTWVSDDGLFFCILVGKRLK